MELKQIEYFVRVAELGSFTQASIALDVAQSALSRHVRLLETELGKNLLIRNGRGVTLTEAGKVLLEHGRGVMHQLDRLHEELAREKAGLVGKVALGLPSSLTKVLAVPLLRSFRSTLPDAVISISEGLSFNMQQAVIDGRLDVAMLYDASPSPDIDLKPVIMQSLYLVQPRPGDQEIGPIELRNLPDIPLVIPRRPNMIRMHVETELASLGLHPQIAIEVDAISAILDLIIEGAGSGVLPYSTIHAFGRPESFNVRPIINPRILTQLSVAVSAHRPATQVQRNLIELIEAKVHELINPSD
jgi:LysR family nitrogen assimilation transcriptional regulator